MAHVPPPIGIALVVCESVSKHSCGKQNLVGVFNVLESEVFPFVQDELTIYVALTNSRPENICHVDIVNATMDEELVRPIQFSPPRVDGLETGLIELTFAFQGIPFPKPGQYVVRLIADGGILLQRPIQICQRNGTRTECSDGESIDERAGTPTMVELTRLEADTATSNKLRWSADVDGTKFSVYIPKWRVPEPWPRSIKVTVATPPDGVFELPSLERERASSEPTLRLAPIDTIVCHVSDHSHTVRFRPFDNRDSWEIGEPYVPVALLPTPSANEIRIRVEWVLATRGSFFD